MTELRYKLLTTIVLFMVWAPISHGQQAAPSPDNISDTELDQRLKFIETRLDRLNPNARRWQYGWTGFYAASAAAQATLAIDENDSDEELNYIVGAVKAAGGLAQVLIKPLPAVTSHGRFQSLPAETRAEKLQKLKQGEVELQVNAERAQQRYGWKRHLIGILANLIGGVIINEHGDSSDAVASTLLGIAVSEASIWTEPRRAIKDLEDYRSNFRNPYRTGARNWRLLPRHNGVVLHINF